MDTSSMLSKLTTIYEHTKEKIVYFNMFLLMIFMYFGDYLGALQDILIPASIVSTIGILFETLHSLETAVLKSSNAQSFTTLIEAFPKIRQAVSKDKTNTIVEIMASSGGTAVNSVIPLIIQSSPAPIIEITIYVISPDSPVATMFPSHWENELRMVLERLETEFSDKRLRITVFSFNHLPLLSGFLINKKHLFLGFFGWKPSLGNKYELTGHDRQHLYLTNRDDIEAAYFFDLFENWCQKNPYYQKIYQFPNEQNYIEQ